ncbi:MAG TPA: YraN family protein [Porphyromonadaceae bacterium]|jgi:putative endonuclease|uniref:YraN family protein n=1 Tax=Limibacterium fermenti TaxID=3229863 RepID=UPI000E8EDEC1|nr:YraN family protein [Porphyromonadaceae bacterium]HBK32839.1 YraN family protein [Porphyromonadaceae bacterium]HBL32819.1 YraN family protein [Porphyromonadaceae bacterium]HBX20597.1 YraN family protein [Porphyromonadaceae bacterium]HBX44703.1 YraN family protein [Porphyromonadaceae bacterium]
MAKHNELGKKGEDAAVRLLQSKGYRILDRNWRSGHYEIDIIARDGDFIVFVEVKTRSSLQWGNPEDFIDNRRMRRMIQATERYLLFKEIDNPARFDVIGVLWDGHSFKLDHIVDAFLPFIV